METNKEGQTVFVNLTPLGKEVGKMVKDGKEYIESYFKLVNVIKEKGFDYRTVQSFYI